MMAAKRINHMPNMAGIRGELHVDEPMSRHTSWRVGGPADWYFIPADRDDLIHFLAQLPAQLPVLFTGLGSNLLVRDGGIRGVVIATHKSLSMIRMESNGSIYAEAGVAGARVARFALRHGLVGAEFFAGIPGCIGGALAMNAGAFGGETWRVVERVDVVNHDGVASGLPSSAFSPAYRHIDLPEDCWFLAAYIRLQEGDVEASRREVSRLLRARGESQPVQSANAGSVFTNPPDDHAARLIESSGLKGTRIGDAEVSSKHANFIINNGDASADDIERLIEHVRISVLHKTGTELVTEVRIAGVHHE
ncbi:MAG: UDP-N-acetylenolpyruvoylglucosamine reductase [marine bacterium B5-7]|nr:MAG: UDP-N-acetylenolpyruvoylglucosamine reductase [marine bacterium B5-7]